MGNSKDIGKEVNTPKGIGIIERLKPGNFRDQNYLVKFPHRHSIWFALNQISIIDKPN